MPKKSSRSLLRAGKLPPSLLEALLAEIPPAPGVVLPPGIGRDAAVLKLDSSTVYLVAKTDPITFATDRIGWYAVNVNANDIACMGATPRWFLATALLPEGSPESLAKEVFRQIDLACQSLDVGLVGGHTEITIGLDRPIVVGCMLGEVEPARLIRPDGALPHDALLLTQGVAIEGTSILAREAAGDLRRRGVSPEELDRCARLLDDPGISVIPAASALCATGAVRSLHDPTEGGLLTAVGEMAAAAGLGARIRLEDVCVLPETERICRVLDLDPLGLLASGALLAALDPAHVEGALAILAARGIPAAVIGELLPAELGLLASVHGQDRPLQSFERDELARYLESQLQ